MICKKCAKHKHHKCKGGTWCDCQHRVKYPPTGVDPAAMARLLALPDFSGVLKGVRV